MKKLLIVAVAFAGFVLFSCNKDQSAVNKLDGTWKVNKMEISDSTFGSIDLIAFGGSASYTFNKCKLKNDSWCTGSNTVTILGATETTEQIYRVTGDGTVLEFKDSDTSNYVSTLTISELTKKEFKGTLEEFGATVEIEATKE